jgi:beta-glucosidase
MEFGSNYVLNSPLPMYEFGYGLSYSEFTYSNLKVSSTNVSKEAIITVSIDISNEGEMDGKEVVQVYVSDVLASVDVPIKKLQGFKKVLVKAGETETVSINLNVGKWGLWDRRMRYVVEPGDFTVFVGSSSEDLRANATVTVR